MEDLASSCDACQSIALVIDAFYQFMDAEHENVPSLPDPRTVGAYKQITLGSFEDLESRKKCTSCQDIVRKFTKDGIKPLLRTRIIFQSDEMGLWIGESTRFEERDILKGHVLSLLKLGVPTLAYDYGRTFDDQQIDINLLRQWINCCQTSHEDQCLSSELLLPSHKIYLVDVEEACLVFTSPECRYIALSYVWGNATTVKTTKRNLTDFKKPGSIRSDSSNLAIPNTIRDALRLVSLLGEKYLWVDSLCIVQDEQHTKRLHLNSMASIYANACFTIVAADGNNADYGLRGTRGAQARNVAYDVVRFESGKQMIIYQHIAWHPDNTSWDSRGWTFQEALFSRRILSFNGLVSWFCRKAYWEEHIHKPTEDTNYAFTQESSPRTPHFAARKLTWPDLETWADYIFEFNKRKLTYDEDVVDAFSGVSSVFNSRFRGILWGIPEMFFDHCILWRARGILRRRTVHSDSLLERVLPSWSWMGWEGEIGLTGSAIDLDNDPRLANQRIAMVPMVRWYKSRSATSEIFPINNSYYSLSHTYRSNVSKELPTGWARELYPNGTIYYSHQSLPFKRFRYPIPLEDEILDSPCDNQSRYLRFTAQRTWLFVGQKMAEVPTHWKSCAAYLVDNRGNQAGSIRLNMPSSDTAPTGEPCELIALSFGTALDSGHFYGLLDEWLVPGRPHESDFYEFYHVMWVERENGIAYRKAIGTVYKDVWENQVLEDVEITLG